MAFVGLALGALIWRAVQVLVAAAVAIPFPLSLDYGEGIVAQQALMVFGPRAYGSVTDLPFVVFHYPPVYHVVIRALATLVGAADVELVTVGRVVSVLSGVAVAIAVGVLAASLSPEGLDGRRRILAGLVAGLLSLGTLPVAYWIPFARVDMLSLALTMNGLALAVCAGNSRAKLHASVLLFVLAIYTKQTALAAPIAVVLVLWVTDRRRALEVIASGLALSVPLLGLAQWLTDGGFLRHIVGYNVNRFAIERLSLLVVAVWPQLPMVLAVVIGLYAWPERAERSPREFVRGDQGRRMILLYFGICTLMLGLIGKSGSSVNYLLEWCCSGAILAGIAFGRALMAPAHLPRAFLGGPAGTIAIAGMLILQSMWMPDPRHTFDVTSSTARITVTTLVRLVQEADRPPISDDMLLVLRGGKPVSWEPAIFAELASLGRWDESLIVDAIRQGRFSMAITDGQRGTWLFDSRYNSAVADAMDAVWPQKATLGWLTLHLPIGVPLPPGAIAIGTPSR